MKHFISEVAYFVDLEDIDKTKFEKRNQLYII